MPRPDPVRRESGARGARRRHFLAHTPRGSERGSAAVSTPLSVLMFVATVSLAAHLLVTLYVRWTTSAAVRDAVHDAASQAATDTEAVVPGIEAHLRRQLGAHGSDWRLTWTIADGRIALSADGPALALWGTQQLHVRETAILEPSLSAASRGSP